MINMSSLHLKIKNSLRAPVYVNIIADVLLAKNVEGKVFVNIISGALSVEIVVEAASVFMDFVSTPAEIVRAQVSASTIATDTIAQNVLVQNAAPMGKPRADAEPASARGLKMNQS